MKKTINLLLLTLLFKSFNISAQTTGGIIAGGNLSILTEKVEKTKGFIGFNFGYYETYQINKKLSIGIELKYSRNSYLSKPLDTVKTTRNYNYIELPVLVRFKLNDKLSIGTGVNYAFGLKGSKKTVENSTSKSNSTSRSKGGFGILLDVNLNLDPLSVGSRFNYLSGKAIEGIKRTSIEIYLSYRIFKI